MTTRNLSQRLKRLEARVLPSGEPSVMRIVFVDPKLGETGSHLVTIGAHIQNQSAAVASSRSSRPGRPSMSYGTKRSPSSYG